MLASIRRATVSRARPAASSLPASPLPPHPSSFSRFIAIGTSYSNAMSLGIALEARKALKGPRPSPNVGSLFPPSPPKSLSSRPTRRGFLGGIFGENAPTLPPFESAFLEILKATKAAQNLGDLETAVEMAKRYVKEAKAKEAKDHNNCRTLFGAVFDKASELSTWEHSDRDEVIKLLDDLKEVGVVPDASILKAVSKALTKFGVDDRLPGIVSEFKKIYEVSAESDILRDYVHGWAAEGSESELLANFARLKALDAAAADSAVHELIGFYLKKGGLSQAYALLLEMEVPGKRPDQKSLDLMVGYYSAVKEPNEAAVFIEKLIDLGYVPNRVTLKAFIRESLKTLPIPKILDLLNRLFPTDPSNEGSSSPRLARSPLPSSPQGSPRGPSAAPLSSSTGTSPRGVNKTPPNADLALEAYSHLISQYCLVAPSPSEETASALIDAALAKGLRYNAAFFSSALQSVVSKPYFNSAQKVVSGLARSKVEIVPERLTSMVEGSLTAASHVKAADLDQAANASLLIVVLLKEVVNRHMELALATTDRAFNTLISLGNRSSVRLSQEVVMKSRTLKASEEVLTRVKDVIASP